MLALSNGNNMSSQPKLHSIINQSDFTFCDIPNSKYHRKNNENENPSCSSSPFWTKNTGFNQLPSSSTSSSSSPMTRMAEGRKELMETINDLPDSWYELSLNYMVIKDVDNNGSVVKDTNQLKGKKKGVKKGEISRSVSLDTGFILLKMFVPGSFGLKKCKVSRSTSMDGLKKRKHKTSFFVESKINMSGSCNENRGCATATQNRNAEGTLKPGCWFKSTNQKGCIFF